MILKKLKIWNFRCFGTNENNQPGLDLDFDPKLNLLIGANDAGKTAIIDAIRYCLGTQTYDPIRVEIEDFYQNPDTKQRADNFKIECVFSDFTDIEAGQFLEWINIFKDDNNTTLKELRVWFTATNRNNRITTTLRAGVDVEGQYLEGEAKDLLRVTYLKPLRDAENELSPGYRSRLYQILKSHPVFEKKAVNEKHPLEKYFEQASNMILQFFEKDTLDKNEELNITGEELGGKKIKESFQNQTQNFLEKKDTRTPEIKITSTELNSILRKLEIILEENKSGLGTLNLLYMATELIHLKRENYLGLRLALIEELEAHLHPQAQLRVLKSLLSDESSNIQYIFSTHSTLLGSSIPLKYIHLCVNNNVYSLNPNYTELSEFDYQFLERFLDATKANLFFAKGVIIVEGDAENIIIPALAEVLDRPLHKYGVSIVNVGNKALLRYANIFKRKDNSSIPIKVAVVTDLDIEIIENGESQKAEQEINNKRNNILQKYNSADQNIRAFISPLKTLEFDIAMGGLHDIMDKSIQIAKKITTKGEWINEEELSNLNLDNHNNENDKIKRSIKIYEPLEKRRASKTVSAQWFAKLIREEQDIITKLKEDYRNNTGIKYLIEAVEHVTETLNWQYDANNG
ncbi:MAG: AAA family ATPase [Candidatus Micrarchaeota archaeon]|nr:AAA family ATPase [Candidatus Micrarchaeota archaeon]